MLQSPDEGKTGSSSLAIPIGKVLYSRVYIFCPTRKPFTLPGFTLKLTTTSDHVSI